MKRLVLCTLITLSILAGCGTAAPSAAPTESAATPAPSVSAPPSAPAAPSAAPSASVAYPTWYTGERAGAGILPAGSQTTRRFTPGFTFTVPEGWVNHSDEHGVFGLFHDTPANAAQQAADDHLANEIFMGPQPSPYFVCDAWEDNSGATADEMVTAMLANDALAVSEPIDVTIGGLTGKQFDVRLAPDWTETCPGDPPGSDLADGRIRGFLLDTPDRGVIVIFLSSLHSEGHEAFLAEAMPIIESFQFDTSQ